MSSLNCTVIQPNPDISGIGVRSAIYAQAVLTLVQPILVGLDGHISRDELSSLHRLYLGILLPGCALVLSAIIQATTYGLSVYHAIIVLNLSWINNTSALIFFQFALIAQINFDNARDSRNKVLVMLRLLYRWLGSESVKEKLKHEESRKEITHIATKWATKMENVLQSGLEGKVLEESRETIQDVIQKLRALLVAVPGDYSELIILVCAENNRLPQDLTVRTHTAEAAPGVGNHLIHLARQVVVLLQRDRIMATLASAHLTLFAAFGLWLWFTIDHFGNCEPLTKSTSINIFVPIFVASQRLRYVSIVIYLISVLPFINIVFFGSLEFAVIHGYRQLIARIRPRPPPQNQTPSSRKSPTSILESPGRPELYQFVAFTFLVQAYCVITNELTIHNNRHLLNEYSQENEWTFGQTLAIALITLPLLQVWTEVQRQENMDVFKRWFKSRK